MSKKKKNFKSKEAKKAGNKEKPDRTATNLLVLAVVVIIFLGLLFASLATR